MPVLDLALFKTMLNIDTDDYDNYLSFVLESAESFVERDLGVILSPATVTEFKFGNDSRFIYTKYRPVNSLVSVSEQIISSLTYSRELDITQNIEINNSLFGELFNKVDYFKSGCRYELKYTAGFEQVPQDLAYAIYQIGIKLYALTDYQKSGASRISTPDGTIVYDSSIIPEGVKEILDRYRRL